MTALPRLLVLTGLIAAPFAAGGCGSSTSSKTSSTTTATQTTATTGADATVSSELNQLPETQNARGTLPAPPTTTTIDENHLRAVFNDAQSVWQREFLGARQPYHPARLVIFSGAVHSGCGEQANSGPFYCPANRTIYLDLTFLGLLAARAGVGPFAQAYIIGHEFGHHVQHLAGIDRKVAAQNDRDPNGKNGRSVRIELQADCLAGVWAHSSHTRGQLSHTDLQEALTAATVIGDDFQQRASGRVVDAAMWTHGSSEQRTRWLRAGFDSGRPASCDTFSVPKP